MFQECAFNGSRPPIASKPGSSPSERPGLDNITSQPHSDSNHPCTTSSIAYFHINQERIRKRSLRRESKGEEGEQRREKGRERDTTFSKNSWRLCQTSKVGSFSIIGSHSIVTFSIIGSHSIVTWRWGERKRWKKRNKENEKERKWKRTEGKEEDRQREGLNRKGHYFFETSMTVSPNTKLPKVGSFSMLDSQLWPYGEGKEREGRKGKIEKEKERMRKKRGERKVKEEERE